MRSRLSCRINFRRNNGRGQKLSGRSFIEQDATGRVRYLCNERVCIVNKNNNLMRKTASYIFSPSSSYGLESDAPQREHAKRDALDIFK